MNNAIQAGDTVYSIDGAMALYVSTAKGGGYIVQPLIEDGDGYSEPAGLYADGVEIWPTVYTSPPQPKLESEIAAQQERLTALRGEVADLERQKREAARDQRDVAERLKQHAALKYIDDMIAGRMPPLCVCFGLYPPSIVPSADAMKNPDHERSYREPAFKLLTLFGDSNGDLQWRLNQYRDGSGSWWDELVFVATQDEGIAEIRRRYALAVAEWREFPVERKHYGTAITWSEKLPADWIDVPEDLANYIAAAKREHLRTEREKAAKALTEAEQKLAALAS